VQYANAASNLRLKNIVLVAHAECGACWAFATAAVAEAASYQQTGIVVSLSEKQLVDCDTANLGCDGGQIEPALKYVVNNGLTLGATYPYVSWCSVHKVHDTLTKAFSVCHQSGHRNLRQAGPGVRHRAVAWQLHTRSRQELTPHIEHDYPLSPVIALYGIKQ
jgi:hypothetical protein